MLLYLAAAMDIISCGTSFTCFTGVQEGVFIGGFFLVKMLFQLQLRYTAINMQSFSPTQR